MLELVADEPGRVGADRREAGTSTCAVKYSDEHTRSYRCEHSKPFLIPIISSMRPSYVSCVSIGVIMSTRRSIITKESIAWAAPRRLSVPALATSSSFRESKPAKRFSVSARLYSSFVSVYVHRHNRLFQLFVGKAHRASGT